MDETSQYQFMARFNACNDKSIYKQMQKLDGEAINIWSREIRG